jgi:broad specificity phosphatase PhoE
VVRVILVRHGQTAWNKVERFRGREDLPLDETGRQQAQAAARYIATSWTPSVVYTSPMLRSVETAAAIADACQVEALVNPELIDIDYGQWQGLTPDEAAARRPGLYQTWLAAPQEVGFPDGESLADVRSRAFASLEMLIRAHAGKTIVVVAHTVVNRLLLCAILGLDNSRFWRLRQETTAINVLEWDDGDFTLVTLNDTCHLRPVSDGGGGSEGPG